MPKRNGLMRYEEKLIVLTHSDMWHHFKILTGCNDDEGVCVLPVLDENKTACFDKERKANVLKETFLQGL